MIVESISNSGADLPTPMLDARMRVTRESAFAVTPGRSYAVYAITLHLGGMWYYIINDDDHSWPIWHPAPLFSVTDGRLPASWKYAYHRFDSEDQIPLISFPEWADDWSFYERLLDGDPVALRVFEARRIEVEDLAAQGGPNLRLVP